MDGFALAGEDEEESTGIFADGVRSTGDGFGFEGFVDRCSFFILEELADIGVGFAGAFADKPDDIPEDLRVEDNNHKSMLVDDIESHISRR